MVDIFSYLPILIFLPLLCIVFILMSKADQAKNVYNLCLLTIGANIIIIWRFFSLIDTSSDKMQLVTEFEWLKYLDLTFVFGVDVFSLFLILAINVAYLVILSCLKKDAGHPKNLAIFSMIFLSMITGLLISCDLFSFYLFFEAMFIPLYLLMWIGGELKKQERIYKFFAYNFFAAMMFFVAIIMLFNRTVDGYIIENIHKVGFNDATSYFIWIAIFISLLSRLPIWPFHSMLSSINASIKNPMIFLISNLMPLTAIYGFVRLLPTNIDANLEIVFNVIKIITMVSMSIITLIAFAHKDFQYKIFSYISITYLFYLMSVFLTYDANAVNISLSFFSFIIAICGIEMIRYKYTDYYTQNSTNYKLFCFFMLCIVGAPISSVFLNNFILFSSIFAQSQIYAYIIFATFLIAGASVISEINRVKTFAEKNNTSKLLIFISFVLLISYVKPFWFVEL